MCFGHMSVHIGLSVGRIVTLQTPVGLETCMHGNMLSGLLSICKHLFTIRTFEVSLPVVVIEVVHHVLSGLEYFSTLWTYRTVAVVTLHVDLELTSS